MEQEVVHYKVYMNAAGYEPEIRRMTVDKDISHNYFYLKQKLISIFPILKDLEFTVSWKDQEGESVRIGSDDELAIALSEINEKLLKIYVSTIPKQQGAGADGVVHTNVVCDSCNNVVQGFRYKCIACTDFDLCAECEHSGNHPEHPMIRIPLPLSPEMPFSRRFGRDLHKMSKHLDRLFKYSDVMMNDKKGAHGDSKQNHGEKKHFKGGCPMTHMTKDFLTYIRSCSDYAELAERFTNMNFFEQPANPSEDATNSSLSNDETKKFVNILTQGLSSFLDPLGSDCQHEGSGTEASTNTAPMTGEASPAPQQPANLLTTAVHQQSQPQAAPSANEGRNMPGGGGDANKQVAFQVPMEVGSPIETIVRRDSPVFDNSWTVIPRREEVPPNGPYSATIQAPPSATIQAPPTTTIQAPPTTTIQAPPTTTIQAPPTTNFQAHTHPYPYIQAPSAGIKDTPPSADIQAQPSAPQAPSFVPNATAGGHNFEPSPILYPAIPVSPISATGNNIDDTMARMTAMGFIDEDGWLRQLVESRQGNLEEVLKFLTPIPKPMKR